MKLPVARLKQYDNLVIADADGRVLRYEEIISALNASVPAEGAQPSGMAMLMDTDEPRLVRMLERLRDDAVMSKFASQRDCEVYRSAVGDMLNMVRALPSPLARPQEEKKS